MSELLERADAWLGGCARAAGAAGPTEELIRDLVAEIHAARAALASARGALVEARTTLEKYGGHIPGCRCWATLIDTDTGQFVGYDTCDCGWDAIRALAARTAG